MAILWPFTLPQVPQVNGYRESFEDRRVVARTETGPGKVRPRSLGSMRTFTLAFNLTLAQVATLKAFYQVDARAGEVRFELRHPRLNASPSPLSFGFIGPPRFTPNPTTSKPWRGEFTADAFIPSWTQLGSLAWPSSLPLVALIDGYDEQFAELAVASDLGGIPERRRRTLAAAAPIQCALRITDAQVITFERFYEGDTIGGVLPYTWEHPREGQVRAAFAGGPELSALGGDLYEVGMAVEVLP